MRLVLERISHLAIKLDEIELDSIQKDTFWIGDKSSSQQSIMEAELRLGVKLPDDYLQFLLITNGFLAPIDIEPIFHPVQEIRFLRDVDPFVIEAYQIPELESSIVVGCMKDEQFFLLIPPSNNHDHWKYWKFANWIPGEQDFPSLEHYFNSVFLFLEELIEKR